MTATITWGRGGERHVIISTQGSRLPARHFPSRPAWPTGDSLLFYRPIVRLTSHNLICVTCVFTWVCITQVTNHERRAHSALFQPLTHFPKRAAQFTCHRVCVLVIISTSRRGPFYQYAWDRGYEFINCNWAARHSLARRGLFSFIYL